MTTVLASVGGDDEKPLELKYTDGNHRYYLSGKRAKSVTGIAKLAADDYAIQNWHQRMVAIGVMLDTNLRENVAAHMDDKDRMKDLCEDAKKIAKAHEPADRGTQMHRVLELVLLDREHKLVTQQQREDAKVLKRTLERYKLSPYQALTEQFVAYPDFVVCGQFDAVFQRQDGTLILVDLKSGVNAVKYPHSTAAQLALYANAPHVSNSIDAQAKRDVVIDWRTMPETLDRKTGFVLLVEPGTKVGTLHEIDIEHGWHAAQLALDIVAWRKLYDYGDSLAKEAQPADGSPKNVDLLDAAKNAATVDSLRDVWTVAAAHGLLTPIFRAATEDRLAELKEHNKIGA